MVFGSLIVWERGRCSGGAERGKRAASAKVEMEIERCVESGCEGGAVLIEGRFYCEADMCNEWPDINGSRGD